MSEYKFLFKIINEKKARMDLSGTISESAKDAILTILTTADPDLMGASTGDGGLHSQAEKTQQAMVDAVVAMERKKNEWIGLTDEDIKDIVPSCTFSCAFLLQCDLFKKIEDKLREKNGG